MIYSLTDYANYIPLLAGLVRKEAEIGQIQVRRGQGHSRNGPEMREYAQHLRPGLRLAGLTQCGPIQLTHKR